ncbi:MAG: HpcH/HpaI aldolase/citrate lyase family protein [Lachnospiraceae bacterium]|nr:HpcH/HpaI aldolase/citrate lyase family protein [Lachnospiraceae bacterium]
MKDDAIYYSVGALMYTPANNKDIMSKLLCNSFGTKFSLAFCLEDTISDYRVAEAEAILVDTIKALYSLQQGGQNFYLPKIFIRVRRPDQIPDLLERFESARDIITGFNAPKFDSNNTEAYVDKMIMCNGTYSKKFYLMPILESKDLVDIRKRSDFLYYVKRNLDAIDDLVLNVRVGGNDLCHLFGLRRHSFETIYNVVPVANILTDILTVFCPDYVVSGPVWEYYSGENWDTGMTEEIRRDLIAGFCGKTVIHPKQIDVLNNACRVFKEDYEDAKTILDWKEDDSSMVGGSVIKSRMNEAKVHTNWARKTLYMAEYYGLK